ncbi:MAG: GAF domain-containing protein [Opitutaceae bacterium]|nr:GAF domain-containing protein [Opitutaceae bacterium]
MVNLLAITAQDDARQRINALLAESGGRIAFRSEVSEGAPLVEKGLFDAVLVVANGASEHQLDEIRALRRQRADLPVAVIVDGAPLAWEESALAAGADFILREPVSAAHLTHALRRLSPGDEPAASRPAPAGRAVARPHSVNSAGRAALDILRDFSHILGYSLDHKLFAEQFVQKVREIVGVSRIAVYLEPPRGTVGSNLNGPRLSCAAAVGIAPDVIECFDLSRTAGIGASLLETPQILLAHEVGFDPKISREFEILGCSVAVPISDRTRSIGVAMLGRHVTGRDFTSDELQLLFLLMEELGTAIKNTWLHQQLTASHRLLGDVLTALSSGCLVVDANLHVLHANRAMVAYIKGAAPGSARLDFGDLPPKLAGPLYQAVKTGEKPAPFFFTGGLATDRLFHVSIIPFMSSQGGVLPQSAMLVLEDFTQIEAAKQLEIEASKARLIALIAKRFAHEIRNSLVPLATHEQLLDTEYQDDDFRRSLKTALARETSRIGRFTEQMLYLAQPPRTPGETVNLRDIVQACFDRVSGSQAPAGKLQLRSDADIPLVRCHRPALEHAIQEVLTNALQARPEEPVVHVSITQTPDGNLRLTVRDNGSGFSDDTAQHALEPFYTTRNTGVGLGLTVARKIVEDHHGRLELAVRSTEHEHDVSLTLPAAQL